MIDEVDAITRKSIACPAFPLCGLAMTEAEPGQPTSLFKMKYDDLEDTVEPIFAMWKTQRATADEALGDFCHRVSIPAVEKYMETYVLGSGAAMPSPFADPAPPAPDGTVGIDTALL